MYCWLKPESSASCLTRLLLTRLTFGGGRCNSGLSLRPATTPKRFRWGLVGSRHDEELDDLGIEGIRQLLEYGDGRIFQPTFEAAYIGSIDTGIGGKSLLGEVALDSKSPEIPRHKCLRPHVERRALRSSLNHGL
jgi:hypothetical protein